MKALDIALKDLLRSTRSLGSIGMMIAAPLLITGLIYLAFGGLKSGSQSLADVKVLVVNQDQPPAGQASLGQSLVDFMQDERLPDWVKASPAADPQAAREAVLNGQASTAVLVPPDFTRALLEGKAAQIVLVEDPAQTTGPALVRQLVGQFTTGVSGASAAISTAQAQAAASGRALEAGQMASVAQQYSAWYTALEQSLVHGPDSPLGLQNFSAGAGQAAEDVFSRMMAGVMAGMLIFFTFYSGSYVALSIIREHEEGTLGRLFTTPTSRATILAGKFLSIGLTILVQTLVLMAASALLFGVNWGQPVSAALAVAALVAITTGFGLALMAVIKNSRQGGTVLGAALAVTGMLGGLFTTNIAMPEGFKLVNLFTPQGWALRAWKLALAGAGPAEIALPVLVMLAAGAVFFVIGLRGLQQRFA